MTGPSRPASNVPEYSVSELSGALKRTVEDTYSIVRVRGEISGFKRHSSGHLYLCLKDTEAVLDAVCWKGQAGRLQVRPEDGLEVVATGRLTTYPGRSKYQMIIESMEVAGEGALLKLLEDRRRKLAAEGLFDPARKKPIPFLPTVIGVVTSPTGAVIRDILHRLADRFPRHVLVWPVAVQGDGAAEQVAHAIDGFNALRPGGPVPRPDLLIVARGGGSLEDLWAFNEEVVVRAAAASAIPLISAVGHETDTTLIDFASDLRAPTPTGAAEKAVPVRLELMAQVLDDGRRLVGGLTRLLDERRTRLEACARGLPLVLRRLDEATQRLDDRAERLANCWPAYLHRREAELDRLGHRLKTPRELLQAKQHQLEQCSGRLGHAMQRLKDRELARLEQGQTRLAHLDDRLAATAPRLLADRQARLDGLAKLLDSYSYKKTLERGFALVRDAQGRPVTDPAGTRAGDQWTVAFQGDQTVAVTVSGDGPPPSVPPASKPAVPRPAAKAAPHKPSGKGDDRQGNLL